ISGLAMADPNALQKDLFRAAKIEADVSGMNLLKKRMQLDRVQVTDASQGDPRTTPGHIIGPPPEPTPETKPDGDTKTIDDYIRSAKEWKERLAQVRRWLEKVSGSKEEKEGQQKDETLQERLEREIREKGYARVQASHLIEGAPTLTITELLAEKVRVTGLEGETLDIVGHNLSTHPRLLGKSPEISIKSSRDTLGFATRIGDFGSGETNNNLSFHYRGLPADKVAQELKVGGSAPFQGGTIDLNAQGNWTSRGGVTVELPLQVILRNTTFSLAGMQPTKVDNLTVPIGIKGPIDNPRIMVDQKALSTALTQAGISKAKEELKNRVQEQVGEKVGDKLPSEAQGLLKGILGGKEKKK
ncbi:MAG TPA: hypothetical protein VK633_13915, partial [Verrucomicrobiae bacterium]|nr:hypothetical protein [Verrucomicrobiae bacterium]